MVATTARWPRRLSSVRSCPSCRWCGVVAGVRALLEMHADDVAARRHDPETLATALVSLATSARPASPAVLAAADTEAVARIRRLLVPPRSLAPRARCWVRVGTAGFALVPLLLALAPAVVAANQPPVHQPIVHAGATRP